MKLKFLGGVDEIGSLGIVLTMRGKNLLLDYGFSPDDPPAYPLQPPDLDAFLLSHAHLDHSGMSSWVAGNRPCPIYATPPTQRVAELLARDSLKIARSEGWKDPFTASDIEELQQSWVNVAFGRPFDVGDLTVDTVTAGHIPGSTMFRVQGDEAVVFTGDLNTRPTRLMAPAKPVPCDTLIIESTYSGKTHLPRRETEADFLEAIDEVVDRGGVAIVPAFAVGRTQEILMVLKKGGYETWLDGMGRTVTEIYLDNPGFVRDFPALENALEDIDVVRTPKGREMALKGDVIVTTSGMVEGGPVFHYLSKLERDRRNAVFLTGYQVKGTGGRRILDEKQYEADGVKHTVAAEVKKFDFSAHLDHPGIVEFTKGSDPERVVLIHGEEREHIAKALREEGFEVLLCARGEEVSFKAPA